MPKETLVRLVLDRLWLKLADITGSKTVRDKKTSDIPAFSGRDYFPPINVTSLSYTRFDRYRDYEDMDANSPYIHTALDIYASDCCQ
ncbi:MAG: hypothetical protein NZM05_12650, partial [Chloroherpetonaceae bacterium]|nr:hypothetical protein [Chloroherpetonaceae bacterium]